MSSPEEEDYKIALNENNKTPEEFSATQNALIDELNEKENIYNVLIQSNLDLKKKIDISNLKYKQILEKIKEKENENNEEQLSLQIKEMEKEIAANNSETDHYKKMIDQLKNKIEFKVNLERALNLQNTLKQEMERNKELKKQLETITRVSGFQKQYIKNFDKEQQISEKRDILKNEIKQTKDTIKKYQEKFQKQDKFIRLIHEKLLSIEMMLKKMKEPKVEKTKLFTKEEFKQTIEFLTNLKNQIKENRDQLNTITKQNDDKINALISQNKKIENDFNENQKLNKKLVDRKNKLKRHIKNINMGAGLNVNKQKKNVMRNQMQQKQKEQENVKEEENDVNAVTYKGKVEQQDIEDNENDDIHNEEENMQEIKQEEAQQKLFSKNPNKNIDINEEHNDEEENEGALMDDEEGRDINDSNLQQEDSGNNISNENENGNISEGS